MCFVATRPYYASISYAGYAPYSYSPNSYASHQSYGYPSYSYDHTPVKVLPTPEAAPLSAAPAVADIPSEVPSVTSTQFHSQDEEGNYAFGYSNNNSYRVESGSAVGGVTGSYYDGFMTYNYVADHQGFRHV